MNSDCERAASFIKSLDKEHKLAFLSRLVYELTLAGRTCYSIDSKGIDNPILLREINELQHQLSAQIMKLVSGDLNLMLPSTLTALFLEREYIDGSTTKEIRRSFIDAITGSLNHKVHPPRD